MTEFLLDVHRCAVAPRYLLFNLTVNSQPHFGQFTTYHIGRDPYYHKRSVTLQSYGSFNSFKSGAPPETIEYIPIEQIKILEIIDGDSQKIQTPLSQIIEISGGIYNIDTSYARDRIKEKTSKLFDELFIAVEEYGKEHPNSNYKTMLAFIEQKEPDIENIDKQFSDDEIKNREIMRDNISELKEDTKKWILDLIFNSAQN